MFAKFPTFAQRTSIQVVAKADIKLLNSYGW